MVKSCLVIGAGIAGLLAARALQQRGIQVTVLDKGRGVGGRMATRRIGSAVFDHGAQFFTARDPQFFAHVQSWLEAGVAHEWSRGFAGPEGVAAADGHSRFRGATGMTSVPKHLALDLEILLGHRVVSVATAGSRWTVTTDTGARFNSDALVLTAPAPQSRAMLSVGSVELPSTARAALESIQYDPCIALMVQPKESRVPEPGGLQLPGEPLSWIADNRRKGLSACEAVTLHAGPGFSRTQWDAPDREIVSDLLAVAAPWISEPVSDTQVHRWRYAKPTVLYPERCLTLATPLPIAFAGDAFGAPRVEGAALSGLAAALAVLEIFGGPGNS